MSSDTPTQSTDPLDEIIAEYLAAEEAGEAPSLDALLAAHPDLADELRRFFANREELADALPGEPPQKQFVPPKVRYFGDYELIDEVARGGMGVVYRAKQTSLNRIVAIKMILSGHLAGDEDVKRFRTEAEAAANLQHPGIVPVHEVGVHEGQHYFSMDYIDGRSLAEIVRDHPLPARTGAGYVRAIADAVQYAHQQGTLHRDLKPSNILVDADEHVHVTDFGLAVRVEGDSELTRTGDILGTPAYMPPEQAQGKRGLIGPASDVYSLGVILYELLTGRPPFRAESTVETLRQVCESDPVSPRLLNPKVPRDLETICLKCLQKEPHKRYATAEDLSQELRRFLVGEPIMARPVGRIERTWRWCQRNPSGAGLAVSVLILVITLFSGTLWFVHSRGTQAERVSRLEQGIADAISNAHVLREQSWEATDQPAEWASLLSSARSAQEQAESLLDQEPGQIDPALWERLGNLNQELSLDERDQRFAARYDAIRIEMGEVNLEESHFRTAQAYPKTREALAEIGLHIGQTAVTDACDAILGRPAPVREIYISALDLCLRFAPRNETEAAAWLRSVLHAVDDDPWRSAVRSAIEERNRTELPRLAFDADVPNQPTSLLITLARELDLAELDEDAESLLLRLHGDRPGDFWVNFQIGQILGREDPALAVRYYQAALAVRPRNAGAWLNLGWALSGTDDLRGALAAYRQAIRFEPDYGAAHNNIGTIELRRGNRDAAIDAFRRATQVQPGNAPAHRNLGRMLRESGDLTGAVASLERAVELEPTDEGLQIEFIETCLEAGEGRRAVEAARRRLDVEPVSYKEYYQLALLLRFTGDVDGYRDTWQTMFDQFAASDDVAGRHAMLSALLLYPEGEGAVTEELLKIAQVHAESGFAIHKRMLGMAHYRRSEDAEALEILESIRTANVVRDSRITTLLCLALVQLRTERLDDARTTIQYARRFQQNAPDEPEENIERKPWRVIPSLWREIQDAMQLAELNEEIPELPPLYGGSPTPSLGAAPGESATTPSSELVFLKSVVRRDLEKVVGIDVSDDGRYAYAASWGTGSVNVFERNPSTGDLTHVQTIARPDRMNGATSVRLSRDGRFGATAAHLSDALVLFARDPDTGMLRELDIARDGIATGESRRLHWAIEAVFSPDARIVYVIAARGDALTWFRITNEHELQFAGTSQGNDGCFDNARGICLSPNGNWLYVASAAAGTLVALTIDPGTGDPEIAQIIRNEPDEVGLNGAFSVTCSADGRFVYTNSGRFEGDNTVCVFEQQNGRLVFIESHRDGVDGVAGLDGGNELVISPDGLNLYALGTKAGAIACFDRDPASGRLEFRQQLVDDPDGDCRLGLVSGIAVSSDGRHVYAAAERDSAISIFERR